MNTQRQTRDQGGFEAKGLQIRIPQALKRIFAPKSKELLSSQNTKNNKKMQKRKEKEELLHRDAPLWSQELNCIELMDTIIDEMWTMEEDKMPNTGFPFSL